MGHAWLACRSKKKLLHKRGIEKNKKLKIQQRKQNSSSSCVGEKKRVKGATKREKGESLQQHTSVNTTEFKRFLQQDSLCVREQNEPQLQAQPTWLPLSNLASTPFLSTFSSKNFS